MASSDQQLRGLAYAVVAFGLWGLGPVYFKAVADVPSLEVLAHRIAWSVVLLAVVELATRFRTLRSALRSRSLRWTLVLSSSLITVNWLVFIWAVQQGHVLEASLGYFINPLVNVVLGMAFLGERLRRAQVVAVIIATVSVAYMTISLGHVPWIALTLATTFGFYGLLRKVAPVGPVDGLFLECAYVFPLAAGYLVWLAATGTGRLMTVSLGFDLLLVSAGVVTAAPLLCFAAAASRLTLVAVGFVQYVAPTGHFLLAVLAYGEPFGFTRGVTFVGIWMALAIFTVEAALAHRAARRRDAEGGPS